MGPVIVVQRTHELSCLKMDVFVATFEFVEFFEHRDRDDHVVLTEVFDATSVMENHIGVEYEELSRIRSRRILS